MSHTITVKLSDAAFGQLQRASELMRQPLDLIVEQSLAHSLPPLLDEIPPVFQSDVYPLLDMSDDALNEEARRRFADDLWAEYESLLDKNKDALLTSPEQSRLNALRHEADALMFRKAYAALLLKRRGYHPPTLTELGQVP